MSHQYAHLYQQQQPQLYDDYHRPRPPSQPSLPQSSYQHPQPLPLPVSPIPLHYHNPISAPSPQYPQQLPGIPHVAYSSPSTSPVSSGLSRRPLPTPGVPQSHFNSSAFRTPLPTPGPTPAPTSPQPHSRASHASSRPASNVAGSSQQPAASLPPSSSTSPTTGRRPLPLPRSAPGHFSDTALRSSSPAKDTFKSPAPPAASASLPLDPSSSPPSQTKFIPYWKRTLPDPSSDRAASASSSQEAVNPGPSGSSGSVASPDSSRQLRDRSKSFTTGRPLPPSPLDGSVGKPPVIPPTIGVLGDSSRTLPNPSFSPVRASTGPPSPIKLTKSTSSLRSSAGSSDIFATRPVSTTKSSMPVCPISPTSSDDDGKSPQNGKAHQTNDCRTPSPQYGIRDLPPKSRSVISQNNTRYARAPASIDCDPLDDPPRGRPNRSSTLSQPSQQSQPAQSSHRFTQSTTVRSAPVVPAGAGPSRLPASTPTSPTGWPNGLPPLPRVPVAGAGEQPTIKRARSSTQGYVNLDDAPPPSLRRSPSPSSVSSRAMPRIKTLSMASNPKKAFTHDVQIAPRRSAASVPSSPEKIPISLPQVLSDSTHQGTRSRSVTPASMRQSLVDHHHTQQPLAPRPPPSAFSQRFASGKPAPSEPQVMTTRGTVPHISTPGGDGDDVGNPSITVSEPELPQITFSDPTDADYRDTSPIDEIRHNRGYPNNTAMPATGGGRVFPPASSSRRGGGLACGGCGGPIVGRIVSAMSVRWHPGCFRCCDCDDLLEYVSSYERDGKPYCHFDYHEVCCPVSFEK